MNIIKKFKKNNLKWGILIGVIILFLIFTLNLFFTGYTINNSGIYTCSSEWFPCESIEDCCDGLDCLGGTCKAGEISEEDLILEENSVEEEVICNGEWFPCESIEDCCDGLDCLGGTCKIIVEEGFNEEELMSCVGVNEICLDNPCCDGLECIEGVCNGSISNCIDSDGGKNYYLKGYISGISNLNENFSYLRDNCVSEEEVKESYCENNLINFEVFSCENGCDNGTCNCKSLNQFCDSGVECCIGFDCLNQTCVLQGEEEPDLLKNKALCTFVGHPCESNDDCCSKNCVYEWQFLFWKSNTKKCKFSEIKN